MSNTRSYSVLLAFAVFLAVSVNFYSWHFPFFWDTILTSTITQYFYENGFHHFITPASFDAGHPPLFYIYVTLFYKLFGRTLLAAHLSMLPFVIMGIVSFLSILQTFNFSIRQQLFGIILFFSVPAVLTQYSLVSYDAVLLSLYLAALTAFLNNRRWIFSILLVGMAGISLRGIFSIAALSVTIYFLNERNKKEWLKWNLWMIPALGLSILWYTFHYDQTGWLISTPNKGWSGQRGFVHAWGFLRNIISIIRCFADLGILFISAIAMLYLIKIKKPDRLMLLSIIPFVLFSLSFLPFTNPVNHRYYLIVYVLMIPVVIQFLSGKKFIFNLLVILLIISGHFFIYPWKISNGWDCTMVHLNYFPLQREAADFIKKQGIDKQQVGTVFPMNASLYQTALTDDRVRMVNVNDRNLDSIPYVLYSNIGNDFSDDQILRLNNWKQLWTDKKGQVTVFLSQNPDFHVK